MKKKIIFVIIVIVLILISIFSISNYKSKKSGNNISNKSAEEIAEYILNISSYTAKSTVTIESNKNTNKYILEQEYSKDNNYSKQVVEEPKNIEGLTTIFNGNELKIENSKLGLEKIYENYAELTDNHLFLETFIKNYNETDNKKITENEKDIEILIKLKNEDNKYAVYKKMYIDKETGKPQKIEIQDVNQKIRIYILYNEININSK